MPWAGGSVSRESFSAGPLNRAAVAVDQQRVTATRLAGIGPHGKHNIGADGADAPASRALTEALHQTGAAALLLDANASILCANSSFWDMFGYAPGDVTGQPVDVLSAPRPADDPHPWNIAQHLFQHGICTADVWCQAKGGALIPVLLTGVAAYDASGKITGYVVTCTDRGKATTTGLALRESQTWLTPVLDSLPAGVVIIEASSHRVVEVNSTALSMIGARKEEVVGSVCHKFICPASEGHCPITDLHQVVDHSERILLTTSGTSCPIIKSVTTLFLDGKLHLLETCVDITDRKRMEEKLAVSLTEKDSLVRTLNELASRDGLTGLYNHRMFYTLLTEEVADAQRYNRPVTLLMLDVDHFKRVNDKQGHQAGDTVLNTLGELLVHETRAIDRVCRYGGEEIAVILPSISPAAAAAVAERLRAAVETYQFNVGPAAPFSITASIGVASFPVSAHSVQGLVGAADAALYRAKRQGRNSVACYEPGVDLVAPGG